MDRRYLDDVTPEEAWKRLGEEPGATLVDVRTAAEWNYVGLPDLSSVNKSVVRVEWQIYPGGQQNAEFVGILDEALKAGGAGHDAPVFFICRSGVRSAAAAAAMTEAGYANCYNVAGGFEGKLDELGHRGTVEGWKAADLPWVQP